MEPYSKKTKESPEPQTLHARYEKKEILIKITTVGAAREVLEKIELSLRFSSM